MTLPTTGKISLSEVNTELKTTGIINMGRTDVRKLANKASGTIKMSDLHGKSSAVWVKVISNKKFNATQAGGSPEDAVNRARQNVITQINNFIKSTYNKIISVNYIKGEYLSTDKLCKVIINKDFSVNPIMHGSQWVSDATGEIDVYIFQ